MHGPEFGKLTEFNVDDVHTARAFGALRALLILESQACLIDFLCGVVSTILEGVEERDGLLLGPVDSLFDGIVLDDMPTTSFCAHR